MSGFLYFISLLLIGVSFVQSQQCQEPIGYDEEMSELCDDDGYFAHPKDCQLFYECDEGNATVWTCLCDYLFDLTYTGCNWPEQTHCGDRPRPTNLPPGPTTTSTTPRGTGPTEEPFNCPEAFGHFPDPNNCQGFYQCNQWVPFHKTCSGRLLYNIPLETCAFPEDVDCGDRPLP